MSCSTVVVIVALNVIVDAAGADLHVCVYLTSTANLMNVSLSHSQFII